MVSGGVLTVIAPRENLAVNVIESSAIRHVLAFCFLSALVRSVALLE